MTNRATPTQYRILHLIALADGITTEAQLTALTGNHHNTINTHLCEMCRAGLINRGKGIVWLTMRGWNENDSSTSSGYDVSTAIPDSSVAF